MILPDWMSEERPVVTKVGYSCADYFRQEIHGLTPLNLRKNDMRR